MPQKSPEQRREYARQYYLRNREKWREYAQNNRESYNARRRQRRAEDPEKARERDRARNRKHDPAAGARERHGPWIHEDEAVMRKAQNGRCYLCGEELGSGKIDIDHDHSCCRHNRSCRTCRRGLAHHRCNVIIGWAGDDPVRLRRMADALEAAQAAFQQRRASSATAQIPLFR